MITEDRGWARFKACRTAILILTVLFVAVLVLQVGVTSNIGDRMISVFWFVGIPLWCLSVLYTTFWPCPNCEKCFATGFVFFVFISNIPFRNDCIHCGYEPEIGSIPKDPDSVS